MRDFTKITTLLPEPIKRKIFVSNVYKIAKKHFSDDELQDFNGYPEALWKKRFSQITFNAFDMYTDFGKLKVYILIELSLKAAKFMNVKLIDLAELGSWENKFKIKELFNTDDDNQTIRDKWGNDLVLAWNVLGSITKWRKRIFDENLLNGSTIIDYGCSTGVLSRYAQEFGIKHSVISDVPGVVLDFAEYQLGDLCTKVPVVSDSPPNEIGNFEYDVAYCHHTLEHVPEPLEVVQKIYDSLKVGGYFYVTFANLPMTVGGINLVKAQEDRDSVLNFFKENFEILHWWESETEYILIKK